jgi:hypothetical protein
LTPGLPEYDAEGYSKCGFSVKLTTHICVFKGLGMLSALLRRQYKNDNYTVTKYIEILWKYRKQNVGGTRYLTSVNVYVAKKMVSITFCLAVL